MRPTEMAPRKHIPEKPAQRFQPCAPAHLLLQALGSIQVLLHLGQVQRVQRLEALEVLALREGRVRVGRAK